MKNNLNLHSVSFDNVGGAFVSFDTFLVLFKPSPEAFISPLPPPPKKNPGGGGGKTSASCFTPSNCRCCVQSK